MKNISRHEGTLRIVSRLPSSVNGNPRYLIEVGGYKARTRVDSSLGYVITNYEGKPVTAILGSHYGLTHVQSIHAAR